MKVLVTGHRGYLGSVLVPMLLGIGHDVSGLDIDLYRRCIYRAGGVAVPVPTIKKDVRDVTPKDLEGFDAVIHLAALSSEALCNINPEITGAINLKGSVRLAAAARHAGVERFLFASTCGSYENSGEPMADETTPLDPKTSLERSKVAAESGIAELADGYFSPTYFRLAEAYGLSPRMRFDLTLNNVVAMAVAGSAIRIDTDGATWSAIIHIEDICRALMAGLKAPKHVVHNQAFNVGSSRHGYRLRDIAEIVGKLAPHCTIEMATGRPPETRSVRVSFEKIAKALPESRPRWDARKGAEHLYAAYKRLPLSREEIEGTRFDRAAELRRLVDAGMLDEQLRPIAVSDAPRPALHPARSQDPAMH